MAECAAGVERGRILAERLGLSIVGTEGHDLKVGCVSCPSSDAARIHRDSGVFHCYACGKSLSAWDLCKVVLRDHEAAKRLMVDVGLFDDWSYKGNGHNHATASTSSPPAANGNGHFSASDEDGFFKVCEIKRMPPDAVKAYGGEPYRGGVRIPMWGSDLKVCSSFYLSQENGKGLNAKGKPTGIFLPGRSPDPGENWKIVEGVKDAAALHKLGHLVAGLPGNHLRAEFAPLFKGAHVTVLADGDQPGYDGAQQTTKVLRGIAASVKVGTFPEGKDARDVLRDDGPEGIGRVLQAATADGQPAETPRFLTSLVTSQQLADEPADVSYIVDGILTAGEPGTVGGPAKSLKTLVAMDLALSVASGYPFLGHFPVLRTGPVGFLSGESGRAVLRRAALRQARSKGIDLRALPITWGFSLPCLSSLEHVSALVDWIEREKLFLLIFDPTYLCLLDAQSAGQAGNLFAMGAALAPLSNAVGQTGATILLLHHYRKNRPDNGVEPADLQDLAMSGMMEWSRFWLLLDRREPYANDGIHQLWLRAGGSAGHAGLYGVTINERAGIDHDGWQTEIEHVGDIRQSIKDAKESRRAVERERLDGEHRDRALQAVGQFPAGETEKKLRAVSRLNADNFSRAIATLTQEGRVESCTIQKGKRQFDGYRPKPKN